MRPIFRRRYFVIISLVAALAATGVVSMNAFATPPPPSLRGVSAASLALTRVTLEGPHEAAEVSQQAAESAALAQFPDSQVLDVVLAHARKPYRLPDAGQLCWVVSITPPMPSVSGPPGSRQLPVRYFLVFVDAHTGKFLFFDYVASANPLG